MDARKVAAQGEAQLLSWSESHKGGPKVVLALSSVEELEQFKKITARDGKRAGQRLAFVFVEINDNEEPVTQPVDKARVKASQLAFLLCRDPDFIAWANANQWQVPVHDEEDARTYILTRCGVESRSELDKNPQAAIRFDALVVEFQEYKDGAFRARLSKPEA